jgi:hypothetical protein
MLCVYYQNMEKTPELIDFSRRMHELCDDKKVPAHGKGRQEALAKIFCVSQKGARKWLEAEAFPRWEHIVRITKWANVTVEWLMTGNLPKRLGEVYATPFIAGMVEVMQTLETSEQAKLMRMAIALKEPIASPLVTEPDPLPSASSGQ